MIEVGGCRAHVAPPACPCATLGPAGNLRLAAARALLSGPAVCTQMLRAAWLVAGSLAAAARCQVPRTQLSRSRGARGAPWREAAANASSMLRARGATMGADAACSAWWERQQPNADARGP